MLIMSNTAVNLALSAAFLFCGNAFAAQTPFDCKTKSHIPYVATISGVGTMNRSIQVTFRSRPNAAEATTVVQACVKLAASIDQENDALGSAWVGADPVKLNKGGFFAYLKKGKSYKFM